MQDGRQDNRSYILEPGCNFSLPHRTVRVHAGCCQGCSESLRTLAWPVRPLDNLLPLHPTCVGGAEHTQDWHAPYKTPDSVLLLPGSWLRLRRVAAVPAEGRRD